MLSVLFSDSEQVTVENLWSDSEASGMKASWIKRSCCYYLLSYCSAMLWQHFTVRLKVVFAAELASQVFLELFP